MMSIRNYGDITGRAREQQMIKRYLSGVGATLLVLLGGWLCGGSSVQIIQLNWNDRVS